MRRHAASQHGERKALLALGRHRGTARSPCDRQDTRSTADVAVLQDRALAITFDPDLEHLAAPRTIGHDGLSHGAVGLSLVAVAVGRRRESDSLAQRWWARQRPTAMGHRRRRPARHRWRRRRRSRRVGGGPRRCRARAGRASRCRRASGSHRYRAPTSSALAARALRRSIDCRSRPRSGRPPSHRPQRKCRLDPRGAGRTPRPLRRACCRG